MQPLIRHRQRCTVAPLAVQSLRIRDVVLCTVGGHDYLTCAQGPGIHAGDVSALATL